MSQVPYRVDDGVFSTAEQNGIETPTFPFASEGDFTTFIYRVPMKVDALSFVAPTPMQQRDFPLGIAYLVGMEFTSPTGAAFTEYFEVYASIPITRIEYGSATGTVTVLNGQVVDLNTGEGISNKSDVFDCSFLYEYALKPLPTMQPYQYGPAPFFLLGTGVNGGTPTLTDPVTGLTRYLLNPSITTRWMGGIYERCSIYCDLSRYVSALV